MFLWEECSVIFKYNRNELPSYDNKVINININLNDLHSCNYLIKKSIYSMGKVLMVHILPKYSERGFFFITELRSGSETP